MADNLPEPKSRKESYLAKAAGMSVTIPEQPESREEQYLNAIAEGGGGGGGGTSNFNELSNRPKYDNAEMTGSTSIPKVVNTAFTGTDGTAAGTAGLVPAPATTDAGKFLKADGTWDTAGGGGPTVVQTTGNSTTDVMSQDATTSMVYADQTTRRKIRIGANASTLSPDSIAIGRDTSTGTRYSDGGVAIGRYAQATGDRSLAIGHGQYNQSGVGSRAYAPTTGSIAIGSTAGVQDNKHESIAIGDYAAARSLYSVALGPGSETTRDGEVNVGTADYYSNWGYNQTKYRLIGGVHDPVDAHDAATKGYVDAAVSGGGGGPTVVQTTGSSTTDVMSQNAVTKMVFEGGVTQKPRIGWSSAVNANLGCALGPLATVTGDALYSVAIGAAAVARRRGEVNIGSDTYEYGYNNSHYRLIGGVYDGQDAHDAVTVEQVNSVIDAINTALNTSIPHIGANS